jgi:hypothetical protein
MRPTVPQQLNQFVCSVGLTPTPISSNPALTSAYIDSLLICVYSTAANSVFFGDQTVTITNGMEIPPGVTVQFSISNERVLYELEMPILPAASKIVCAPMPETQIPFVYWDMSQLYLIAAAATNTVIIPFKRAYV